MIFVKQKTSVLVLLYFVVITMMIGVLTCCELRSEVDLTKDDEKEEPEELVDTTGDVETIDDNFQNLTNEIKNAYIEKYSLCSNPESIHISYICTFEDVYAIQVTIDGIENPCIVIDEEVNGLIFSYYSGNAVKIYANGKFYSVKEAYKIALLSEYDLKILHETCSDLGYALNIQLNL